ncbi:uncharacterized protein FIBRA_00691 [Fibroporia radiculosa]|uniref:Phosphatidate cytidylyltransferase n=1 Tax=Fibroporia radiculosa TaxID=599839 RepID=J4G0J8_9APHY|nr:uncharacterized protein FIBRA_00691 [Fibroporia radiculosa]CCL98688.1 predicted protein [Fibroporia radiculosa]
MSTTLQPSRPSWASKSAFDALAVESGEESEDELFDEPAPVSATESGSESMSKPSKSALKKAKEVARLERQQQRKAAARAAKAQSVGLSPSPAQVPTADTPATTPKSSAQAADAEPAEPSHTELPAKGADEEPSPDKPYTNGTAHLQVDATPAPPKSPPMSQVASAAKPSPPASVDPPPELKPAPIEKPATPSPPKSANSEAKVSNGHVDSGALKQQEALLDGEQVKKRRNILTRTLWTFIMIGGFLMLLLMGHAYMIMLVLLCQTLVYREVTSLFSLKRKDSGETRSRGRDPWSKTLNWYFFVVTNYFLYGESIIYYFKHVVFADAQLTLFATNHRMVSFTLYTIGFMGFVMSLQRGYLKQQFGLFCWVHMTLLLVVVSSHFIMNNILEGMIWFWVPASLVICNDVFAYIWGMSVGRTPLIKLSPKKTVEGFVGAFFSTVVFGVLWGTYFMRFDYMICPVHDLGVSAWSETARCDPNPVFVWRDWAIPAPMGAFLTTLLGREITTISYAPYQYHLLFMSCFASLVAPFGGFFASGFKRAFNIKDFGHSIPGHGGMTDRMDCQFLMGVFTYVYYSSLIRQNNVSVGSLLQMIVSGLTPGQQLELMGDLKRYLEGQGIVVNI